MADEIPEILNEYMTFCNIRKNAIESNILDLSDYDFMYPTCLLPSIVFKNDHSNMEYVPPSTNLANYISIIEKKTIYLWNQLYSNSYYI